MLGCSGVIGGEAPSRDGTPGSGESPRDPGGGSAGVGGARFRCDPGQTDPGPSPLMRLTPAQYDNTVRHIFGDGIDLASVFPNAGAHPHIGLVQADVSQLDVETYQAAAAIVATSVRQRLDELAPCGEPTTLAGAEACAADFVGGHGPLLYRSELAESDAVRLLDVFRVGYETEGYAHGIELVVEAMLGAPRFLYRPELGQPGASSASEDAVPLSSYELLARLTFAFWNGAPDAALFALARGDMLSTEAGFSAVLSRIVDDPRADASFRGFLHAWFGLGELAHVTKDPALFPAFGGDTPRHMVQQSDAFFDAILFGEDGTLERLFSAPLDAHAPAELSSWYEARPAGTTGGVLTLPALLSVHSKPRESFPIYRGLFVREQLLCQQLPAPPADVPPPPTPTPGVSARERFARHSADSGCSGCHELIDPIGFGFENYDAIGRYRSEEDGVPIDASGELTRMDLAGPFDGVAELSARLGQSDDVRACAARQWFRYAMARFEQAVDDCTLAGVMQEFQSSGYRLSALRESLARSPAFRHRRPIQLPESEP